MPVSRRVGIKKRNRYGGIHKGCVPKWSLLGSNQGPTDYESVALTNCAKGPD